MKKLFGVVVPLLFFVGAVITFLLDTRWFWLFFFGSLFSLLLLCSRKNADPNKPPKKHETSPTDWC